MGTQLDKASRLLSKLITSDLKIVMEIDHYNITVNREGINENEGKLMHFPDSKMKRITKSCAPVPLVVWTFVFVTDLVSKL